MKRSVKEQFVVDFKNRIEESAVFYLTDFSGLDVKSLTELRAQLRGTGSEFVVVKNRLARLALDGLDIPDISEHLKGPTGFVFATEAVQPAKTITDFAKTHGDRPVFKVGFLESNLVDATGVARLATLPPREQLLAMLAGALEAPMAALAGALSGKVQEMAGLIDALKETKG